MSLEEQQRSEITRLMAQVEQLQKQFPHHEADQLRNSVSSCQESEELQTVKAELDHERQKQKAIWAAVRHIAGEDALRRIEQEVSRRPIVAAPKVRRRGTMPHMPAPHMTVVTKCAAAPKWPPAAQEESPAPEVVAQVAVVSTQEQPMPGGEVDCSTVPPSVASRVFESGFKGKDQKASAFAVGEPIKLDSTPEPQSGRVATIPSPLRHRESSTASMAGIPPLPRSHTSQSETEAATPVPSDKASQKVGATPVRSGSVRDRIRQLELSARRNSVQN